MKRRDYKSRDKMIASRVDWNAILWVCCECGRKNSARFANCPRCGCPNTKAINCNDPECHNDN